MKLSKYISDNHWVSSASIGNQLTVYDSRFIGGELCSPLTHQLALLYRTMIKDQDNGEEIVKLLAVRHAYILSSSRNTQRTVVCLQLPQHCTQGQGGQWPPLGFENLFENYKK